VLCHPLLLLLLQMMMNFTVDCVRSSKDGVLLLITADAGEAWWHALCCAEM
jgi:hypothetical protein